MLIVNTLNGAVTGYSAPAFASITAKHFAGECGLHRAGGDVDTDSEGEALVMTHLQLPATLRESTLKQAIEMVYLSMRGEGVAQFAVRGAGGQRWAYEFPLRTSDVTRCPVGRGIRENYMGFELSTPKGQAFTLDRIEVLTVKSKNRRV